MPVAPILRCKALVTANGAVYRHTITLALAYWLAGCKPLPTDDVTLASLVRQSQTNWLATKTAVIAALAQITPHLDDAHDRALKHYLACQANGRKGLDSFLRNVGHRKAAQQPGNPIPALATRDNTPRRSTDMPIATPNANATPINPHGHEAVAARRRAVKPAFAPAFTE